MQHDILSIGYECIAVKEFWELLRRSIGKSPREIAEQARAAAAAKRKPLEQEDSKIKHHPTIKSRSIRTGPINPRRITDVIQLEGLMFTLETPSP